MQRRLVEDITDPHPFQKHISSRVQPHTSSSASSASSVSYPSLPFPLRLRPTPGSTSSAKDLHLALGHERIQVRRGGARAFSGICTNAASSTCSFSFSFNLLSSLFFWLSSKDCARRKEGDRLVDLSGLAHERRPSGEEPQQSVGAPWLPPPRHTPGSVSPRASCRSFRSSPSLLLKVLGLFELSGDASLLGPSRRSATRVWQTSALRWRAASSAWPLKAATCSHNKRKTSPRNLC